mmetsp:Transcript_42040/g.76050  ORF Transcript_42040/g.76050 Transcript_42040/m.76050 type:complete len:227 (-) Transcript_42040:957-1637(-)
MLPKCHHGITRCQHDQVAFTSLGLDGRKHLEGFRSHETRQLIAIPEFGIWHVLEVLVRATRRAEGRDADAGAVELANHKVRLAIRAVGALLGVLRDEVAGPQQWQRLATESERRHDDRDVLLNELHLQVHELGLVRCVLDALQRRGWLWAWLVEGHDVVAANSGQAVDRKLVNDLEKPVADHLHADLALLDAREEALVHELATCLLATLEVLAWEGRLPVSRSLSF